MPVYETTRLLFSQSAELPPRGLWGILLGCLLFSPPAAVTTLRTTPMPPSNPNLSPSTKTDAANNAVRVMANGAWQVYWGACLGGRDGRSFGGRRQQDFPGAGHAPGNVRRSRGAHRCGQGLRQNHHRDPRRGFCRSDRFARSRRPALRPCGHQPHHGDLQRFVECVVSDPALVFSPASGTGDGTITVTAAPEGVRCTLTVTAGEGPRGQDAERGDTLHGLPFPELASNWVQPSKDAAAGSGDYAFYTHWTTTVSSRKTVRNYSIVTTRGATIRFGWPIRWPTATARAVTDGRLPILGLPIPVSMRRISRKSTRATERAGRTRISIGRTIPSGRRSV